MSNKDKNEKQELKKFFRRYGIISLAIFIALLIINTNLVFASEVLDRKMYKYLLSDEGKWGQHLVAMQKTDHEKAEIKKNNEELGNTIKLKRKVLEELKFSQKVNNDLKSTTEQYTIGYKKDGKNYKISNKFQYPQKVLNNRVAIAIRDLEKAFEGVVIDWNQEYQTALIRRGDIVLAYPIDKGVMSMGEQLATIDASATIDPETKRTYLPLRDIAEKLGYKVTYLDKSRVIILEDNQ